MLLWTELTIEYQLIGKLHHVQHLSHSMFMLQQQQQQKIGVIHYVWVDTQCRCMCCRLIN